MDNKVKQTFGAKEIREKLDELDPEIPWTHYYDFGHGIETITKDNDKFYKKSIGLRNLGNLVTDIVKLHTCKGSVKGLRVLDIASAEGVHSILLAQKGATVIGIEGRELYVKRARLAAHFLNCGTASFFHGDVRKMDIKGLGKFDLVLCSGILHHLDKNSFVSFINDLGKLTGDTLVLYTHISTAKSIERFQLNGPVVAHGKYQGYLFREHSETTTKKSRLRKVRASLDNQESFWATQESLVHCLEQAEFTGIYNILKPHIFRNFENASYRPIIVARK